MAGFKLVKNMNDVQFERVRIASQAYTIGDAVMLDRTSDSVDVVPATSSTTTKEIYAIAMETVASTATSLLVAIIEPSQVWECESANNTSANHIGQRAVLTDANTVNNTGTDSATDEAVCLITGFVGAVADKRILVKFLQAAIAA